MNGWRSSAGRRPSASGRSPDEIIAIRARSTVPSSPAASQRLSSRYHGRKRQFSCTIRRDSAFDAPGERLRFGERRRHRLLAQHVDASRGGRLDPRRMRLARRGDVERIDRLGSEHCFGIAVDAGMSNSRARRVALSTSGSQIATRRTRSPTIAPRGQVVPADHPGARQRDTQRFGDGGGSHELAPFLRIGS